MDRKILMNDGIAIPQMGLGVYLAQEGHECVASVKFAIEKGYRHFDTAQFYGNEKSVADGIIASGINREDVFVTSKIWSTEGGYEGTIAHVKKTLETTGLDYFDLYLIHAPQGGNVIDCYKALFDLKKEGLVKSVGVSNFGIPHLDALEKHCLPKPSTNQIELHPWQQKRDIVKYCQEKNIVLTAYSPLTKGEKLNDQNLIRIAKKLNLTPAQVLINWCLQNGFVTIPKTSKKERIVENTKIATLPKEVMDELYHFGDKPWSCTWDPTLSSLKSGGL